MAADEKTGSTVAADRLNLSESRAFQKVLGKLGSSGCFVSAQLRPSSIDGNEDILFSDHVVKINRRGKKQNRILCITNRAIYNLKNPGKCQRRIDLKLVKAVSFSKGAEKPNQFAIHVPSEYDYHYDSPLRKEIRQHIQEGARSCDNNEVAVGVIDDVRNLLVTKPDAVVLSRTDRLHRYRTLLQTEDDEDDDEDDAASYTHMHGEHVRIEDFNMVSVLGRGAFGKVMEVEHQETKKKYAMKILRIHDIIKKKQVDHTKTEREMLEAMQHPFLMGLKFAFKTRKKLYFVLDYYPGGELFFHLQKRRQFQEQQARLWVAEIALALGHLHELGYIYRDLKPENIVLGLDGHVCLTDFGLAKSMGAGSKKLTYSFVGTPEYLAPEIINNKGHNKNVDWWSLGILLFELCNGLPPFYSKNPREMYSKIVNAGIKFRKGPFSPEYQSCIRRLLDREPKTRLGSRGDIDEIMAHPFFQALDRDSVMQKAEKSAYIPEAGEKHVAKEFRKEDPTLSMAPTPQLGGGGASFLGFTFQASGALG